ncbi:MAG: S-methyl-5-thioribose-1-phosphate isomerase [Bacteroidales bacterium]|nr:S-methyl-5-thioribose-1-phosphate isomerase [Bacteroidales bacterium]
MKSFFENDAVELTQDGKELIILDQTLLPNQEKYIHITTAEQLFYAITLLKVRGSHAIGISAALGLAMCMNRFETNDLRVLEKEFLRVKKYLVISRPSAVDLFTDLNRMESCFYEQMSAAEESGEAIGRIKERLTAEARNIKLEKIRTCLAIAEYGFGLMKPGACIMTYCNAGHLAVSRYGTALGPIFLAQENGYMPKVFVCETRPLLQGARLTAYELGKAGVDATLICDNMASIVMSRKKVDMIFVGADTVAANGDVVNKVGTSGLAILAQHYGVPFYVLCPSQTIDSNRPTGFDVKIEERPGYEVTEMYFEKPSAPIGTKVYNPAFDVTPASMITGIITENGIYK